MEKFKINNSDMNLIDVANSTANVDYKISPPMNLKGALGVNTNFGMGNSSPFNILQNKQLWILQKKNEIISGMTENWEYENLPNNITKYDLENKNMENGSCAFVKIYGEIFCVNYNVVESNIYNNPIEIKISEPKFKIDGMVIKENDFVIMQNTMHKSPVHLQSIRLLNLMEKCLYEIEKNITISAPKGLILNNGLEITTPDNKEKSDALNSVVNGQNTFYELNLGNISSAGNLFNDIQSIFVPIELADRTDSLIRNYSFFNEELKQTFGLGRNSQTNKKANLITDEVEKEQKQSDLNLQHYFNIRKLCVEKINEKFNLEIKIIDNFTETFEEQEIENEGQIDESD